MVHTLFMIKNKTLTLKQVQQIEQRIAKGDKKSVVARDFGISRETLPKMAKLGL